MKRCLLIAVAAVMTLGAWTWSAAPATARDFHPRPARVYVHGHAARRVRVVHARREVHVRVTRHREHRR